jgi:asparagine synthase (glutamine-hydrolysing)
MDLLQELVAQGRWLALLREGRALVRFGRHRWRGLLVKSFGPWMPELLWKALHRLANKELINLENYSALSLERRRGLDIDRRTRPQRRVLANWGVERRLGYFRSYDISNFTKGVLGGWGVDKRDPTADRRLVEFCLSLPMSVYLEKGRPRALGLRALADRLPACVLAGRRAGMQAIDWHEGLTASRDCLREEIERLTTVPAAAATLDLARMRKLVDDWPAEGWNTPETMRNYQLALMRGAANGHFLRKASRSNA